VSLVEPQNPDGKPRPDDLFDSGSWRERARRRAVELVETSEPDEHVLDAEGIEWRRFADADGNATVLVRADLLDLAVAR
jgi:hypothetical protein